ncbi:MAG TPA: alanine racemase [Candidatus Lokiarchaeia archaeon]|nr:alanine racemase [Candidatus Lokiarchaeia archaeon]
MPTSLLSNFLQSVMNFETILQDEPCPSAIVDLDAFDHNIELFTKGIEGSGKKLRVGTKSVRVPALIKRAMVAPGFKGVFLFHPNEIQYLHDELGIDDFILAYPIMNLVEAETCARAMENDPEIRMALMADSIEHLQVYEKAAAKRDVELHVLVDVDMSIRFLGQQVGTLRSPLATPEQVVTLALKIKDFPHLKFKGIMGYEAQEASAPENSFLFRKMKQASRGQVTNRRAAVVHALEENGMPCEIVNGGGSGCFKETAKEGCVTEVTVGSGLFKPHLFDSMKDLQDFIPSLFMALRVVRTPCPGTVTAFSGGYVCSGGRLFPKIVHPQGCMTTKREGFGEVQTPFTFDPKRVPLRQGSIIICRLAKAGEPMERFNEIIAISKGEIVDRFKTYRGCGLWLG